MGQTGLHKRLEDLVADRSEEEKDYDSVSEYMQLINKKQRNGQIHHIPPNKGNYLAPSQIVFAEITREFISSQGFGFYEDQTRNYLIDFMLTCQFELPRS